VELRGQSMGLRNQVYGKIIKPAAIGTAGRGKHRLHLSRMLTVVSEFLTH
jgi:hypothetical protein